MFDTLIDNYALDLDNTAVYYLFDRDPDFNTDKPLIEDMLHRLERSRDTNPDVEAFTGMNLLQRNIGYCWGNGVVSGSDLKASLQQMEKIGIDTDAETPSEDYPRAVSCVFSSEDSLL